MHSKADDPPREVIHNDENPVRLQGDGLAAKQIDAPKTILCVTDERQPRWTSIAGLRLVMLRENPPYHVFVDL